jgi:3-phenylpropionate/trans-cinnamate dioxygenase ferredoxin reductase component
VKREGVLIAGGGLAGQRCAESLRRDHYQGRVRMICAEPHLPYDRPPLSKAVLHDQHAKERLGFRSRAWYETRDIEVTPWRTRRSA